MDSLKSALEWRYATKQFDATQKLTDATVRAILDETTLSASSYVLQPYEFIVVTNAAVREKLKTAAWNQGQITDASHLVVLAARTDVNEAFIEEHVKHVAHERSMPVEALNGYKDMMLGFVKGHDQASRVTWAQKQTYIAVGTFLASAALQKVDSCPMEGFDPKAFDDILGLKAKHLTATVVIPIGHRAAADKSAHYKKVRWPATRMVHELH